MSTGTSGLSFHADATNGREHRLIAGVTVEGPFTGTKLLLRFPRWVPGSYFLREPIQHMFDFEAVDQEGTSLNWKRVDVDGITVTVRKATTSVHISYCLFANELSVRSNHLDATHLHLMPPFTWFWPEKGIDIQRLKQTHIVTLTSPSAWTPATQLDAQDDGVQHGDTTTWSFSTVGRDMMLDSIIEVNANPAIVHVVDGRPHQLKWWDSGGHAPNQERLQAFLEDMERIIREHHALFGVPDWPRYTTVLHLTETGRGGLEHMNSQTSMVPRQSLFPNHEEDYRDLVSLFSHEYLHQWNVKRLRPKCFLEYDLQSETHTDLLWWFEGGTSWLGDMICVRSGAWTEEDWRLDFERKMKRHTQANGMHRESLAESSHDAWIHLYRSGPYTRESQISYYLEGELAMLCLDVELRRRNQNTYGACDLMAEVVRRFSLTSPEATDLGVEYRDIRSTLKSCPGGSGMGPFLDRLVKHRALPNIEHALRFFRLRLAPHASDKANEGWLGVNLRDGSGTVHILSYHSGSPLRLVTQVGDQLVAVDDVLIRSAKQLQQLVAGRVNQEMNVQIAHEGILSTVKVTVATSPQHGVSLQGKGNDRWKAWLTTRQAR